MKIIVIGASGMLGQALTTVLKPEHEVIELSRRSSISVSLDDPRTIDQMFAAISNIDAVVCCAANVPLTPLAEMSDDTIAGDLQSKLLGQVALARRATQRLTDGGSITLTAGTFDTPIPGSSIGALVNAGLQGFVRSAAVELTRGLRINAVSPSRITETLQLMGNDGARGTPVSDVAAAYPDLIEGTAQGTTIVSNSRP